jgi:hypothetical protein
VHELEKRRLAGSNIILFSHCLLCFVCIPKLRELQMHVLTVTTRMGLRVTGMTCGAGQHFMKFENQQNERLSKQYEVVCIFANALTLLLYLLQLKHR